MQSNYLKTTNLGLARAAASANKDDFVSIRSRTCLFYRPYFIARFSISGRTFTKGQRIQYLLSILSVKIWNQNAFPNYKAYQLAPQSFESFSCCRNFGLGAENTKLTKVSIFRCNAGMNCV